MIPFQQNSVFLCACCPCVTPVCINSSTNVFDITKLQYAFFVAISSVDTIFMLYLEFPL